MGRSDVSPEVLAHRLAARGVGGSAVRAARTGERSFRPRKAGSFLFVGDDAPSCQSAVAALHPDAGPCIGHSPLPLAARRLAKNADFIFRYVAPPEHLPMQGGRREFDTV